MKKINALLLLAFFIISGIQAQTITVTTSTELQNAINVATPGQTIVLANGTYSRSGGFYVNAGINGTSSQPITLQGNANTIITSNNQNTGYGFALKGNTYWVLDGFTVYNSKKGIVLDNSHHNVIKNITVNNIGDEGIHLRTYSSFNSVEACTVDYTGLVSTGTGEGIYVGSANSNWATYTNGDPDTCNYNVITRCSFGAHIASENIDIKEGTKGGVISFNQFNGAGLNGQNFADSWLDMKGNSYTISCNTGVNTTTDGFQTHINYAGYGDYNTFSNNNLTVGATGYGINVTTSSSNGTATHNVVCNNNTVDANAVGLTNVTAQTCSVSSCSITTGTVQADDESACILYPNPAAEYLQVKLPLQSGETKYWIKDISGRVMQNGQSESTLFTIDIHHLPRGIYLIFISTTDQPFQFVKQ